MTTVSTGGFRSGRLGSVVAATAVLSLGLLLPSGAGARAAERPLASAKPASVFSSPPATRARPFGFGTLGASVPINCSASIGDPYESRRVPGLVNVIARVRCTRPIARIGLRVNLVSRFLTRHRPLSKERTSVLNGSASLRCRPGNYRGTANVTLVFPRGYRPSPQRLNVYSAVRALDCR